jgi:hypothetical protein
MRLQRLVNRDLLRQRRFGCRLFYTILSRHGLPHPISSPCGVAWVGCRAPERHRQKVTWSERLLFPLKIEAVPPTARACRHRQHARTKWDGPRRVLIRWLGLACFGPVSA